MTGDGASCQALVTNDVGSGAANCKSERTRPKPVLRGDMSIELSHDWPNYEP